MRWAERFPTLWALLEQVATVLFGSFLFWLTCSLLVTLPAGIAGLYGVMGPLIRSNRADGAILRPFWEAFRQTALTGLLLFLIDLTLALLLWVDIRFFWGVGALWGQAMALLAWAVAVVALMVNIFAWPLLAWYPQSLGSLLRRAFLLAGAHPFRALAGVAALALFLLLAAHLPGQLLILVPLMWPGLMVGILGWIAWSGMRRYEVNREEAV